MFRNARVRKVIMLLSVLFGGLPRKHRVTEFFSERFKLVLQWELLVPSQVVVSSHF